MPEHQTPDSNPETPSYVPASPAKRVLAWVGVVYMVIIVALTTWAIATGETLGGLTGLMMAPACGGLAALSFLRWRNREYHGSRAGALAVAIGAAVLCGLNLFWAAVSLSLQLRG